MIQVIEQTHDEKMKMYMKCTKQKLAEMLIECNRILTAQLQGDVSGSDLVKSDWNLRECFKQLRFDKHHHLGFGDIRLTISQQEEICDLVERFYHCR